MNSILEIPDSADGINQWLEELILSVNFSTLVGQLKVVNELANESPTSLISDDRLGAIAVNGMDEATADECRSLLRSPEKLAELRQRVFEIGSAPWLEKIKTDSSETKFLSAFYNGLFASDTENLNDFEQLSHEPELTTKSINSEGSKSNDPLRRLISIAAVLAFLGLGIYFVLQLSRQGSSDWGWQSTTAMPEANDPSDYLESLSRSGLEWFDQQRNTPLQLAARLEEFSSGCQRLINAPHSPLRVEDRDWLVDKCQSWKVKIDQLASAAGKLDSNSDADFKLIKDSADDLASKIGLMLSRRAKSI